MGFATLKLLLTGGILATGLMLAWVYLLRPSSDLESQQIAIGGTRPWRRLGGGICLVLAIMFPLGVYVVDIPDHPRAYAAYWVVIMVLVLWLAVLAARDVMHTRTALLQRRIGAPQSSDPCRDGSDPPTADPDA